MSRTACGFLVIVGFVGALASSAGLSQSVHKIPAKGLSVSFPTGWQTIPIKPGEQWILAKFIGDREVTIRGKDTSGTLTHRPSMRVLSFPKVKDGGVSVEVEKTDTRTVTVIDVSRPYRNYDDYLKRNFQGGGYFVSAETNGEVGAIPVTQREVTIEKMAAIPRRLLVCIYHLPEEDVAVEIDVAEAQYEDVKGPMQRVLKSLTVGTAAPGAAESKAVRVSRLWFLTDDKEFAKEQAAHRRQWRERVLKQVTQDLPKGWTVKNEKNLVVVGNASAKYTELLVWQAVEVRQWLEARFKDVGQGEVMRSILRVCSSPDVASAYQSGSGDSYVGDTGEVVCAERGGSVLSDFSTIAMALLSQYLNDKNPALGFALPGWVMTGLISHLSEARISKKQAGLIFTPPIWALREAAVAASKKQLIPLADFVSKPREDLAAAGEKGDIYGAQAVLFVRFLLDGPGAKGKSKGLIQECMARSLEVLEAADKKQWKDLLEHRTSKDPLTEEEEEEEFKRRQRDAKKFQEEMKKHERERLAEVASRTFGDWTAEDWKRLDAQFSQWIQAGLK